LGIEVKNGTGWEKSIEEAKVHTGLQWQRRRKRRRGGGGRKNKKKMKKKRKRRRRRRKRSRGEQHKDSLRDLC